MADFQAKLDAAKAAAAAAGPCVFEEIQSPPNWKTPAFFGCTSGVLLWGQLPTVMAGSLATELDTALGPYHTNNPGVDCESTVLQSCFRYRAPARKGLWKVDAVFGGGTHPLGYICHHVDVNGADLVRRAAIVGASLVNDHEDRDIVYVNRYDWAQWGCPSAGYQLMTELLKLEKKPMEKKPTEKMPKGTKPKPKGNKKSKGKKPKAEDEDEGDEYKEALVMNRLMLVDAQGFPHLVQSLRDGVKLYSKNYLFRNIRGTAQSALATQESQEPSSSDAFGVNLNVGYGEEGSDGELGWMAFQNGELVGIVYDGAYCDLEGRLWLGGTEVEVPHEPTPEYSEEVCSESEKHEECEDSEDSEDSYDGWNRFGERRRI